MNEDYGHDDGDSRDRGRRPFLSTTWGRAMLVYAVLGIVAFLGVPYAVKPPVDTEAGRTGWPPARLAESSDVAVTAAMVSDDTISFPTVPVLRVSGRSAALPTVVRAAARDGRRPRVIRARARAQTGKPAGAPAPAPAAVKPEPTPSAKSDAKAAGDRYWVQVGAYKDVEIARRVAARLREQRYPVIESVLTRAAVANRPPAPAQPAVPAPATAKDADRYEVVVSGKSQADVDAHVAAKGLAARSTPEGAVITPSLPLRDAVALSKDLTGEGITVTVRRVGASPPPAPAAPSAAAGAASAVETLYRVRVGAYPDRAAAMAILRELEGKGYKPFLGRGGD